MINLPTFNCEFKNWKSKIIHILDDGKKYAEYNAIDFLYRWRDFVILEWPNDDKILITSTTSKNNSQYVQYEKVLYSRNLLTDTKQDSSIRWIKHPQQSFTVEDITASYKERTELSRKQAYSMKEEITDDNNNIISTWLRKPQIGSIHAIKSFRTVSSKPATIVLPTGTWKTEVMVSLLAEENFDWIFVLVPSKSLRRQLSKKFLTLWILKNIWIISWDTQYPVVWIIEWVLTEEEINVLLDKCHVIVSIIDSVSLLQEGAQNLISSKFSHLFVDEAHHVSAKSWSKIRTKFVHDDKKVLQFTATPFRNDGKYIDWKIIYNFPLKLAQKEWYFKEILFHPIEEFDPSLVDKRIAEKALEVLSWDIQSWYNHIIMARAQTKDRAREIFEIYRQLGSEHNPVLLFSWMSNTVKTSALESIENWTSKIIICVNMLWEWYDLPSLKIAALHDNHKSLGITLQFIWRFTRTWDATIGKGSVISNIVSPKVEWAIRNLYAENSDWNAIIAIISSWEIARQMDLQDIIEGFSWWVDKLAISIQNLSPKFRTFAYRCEGNRNPTWIELLKDKFNDAIVDYNIEKKIIIMITEEITWVDWWAIKDISNTNRDLHLAYFHEELNMLFIWTSSESFADDMAKNLVSNYDKIHMDEVFKALWGIDRLLLNTLWLKEIRYWPVRFRMYAWYNIEEWISSVQTHGRTPSNLFWVWYEGWKKATIWVSTKGKIRCKKVWKITDWMDWCENIWIKLNTSMASTSWNSFIFDALKYIRLESYSDIEEFYPIAMQRPEYLLDKKEERVNLLDSSWHLVSTLLDSQLEILEKNDTEMYIMFCIKSDNWDESTYKIQYENIASTSILNARVSIQYTKMHWNIDSVQIGNWAIRDINEFFLARAPAIFFSNWNHLENEYLLKAEPITSVFGLDKIETLDWSWVTITSESQWPTKQVGTIQKHMIDRLDWEFEILFDDDWKWEIADIIWIRFNEEESLVEFHFYHCKFSHWANPWARLADLYEVCGQAQKNIAWAWNHEKIFSHMQKRELKATTEKWFSRFESWDFHELDILEKKSKYYRCKFFTYIVQPWVKKIGISDEQKELLWATENYLMETFKSPLLVYTS